MKAALKNSKGFTIFELIIVIAILGILAAVLFPKMMGREAAAKVQTVEMDMLRIAEACQTWKANNGKLNFTGLTYGALSTAGLWNGKFNPWGSAYSLTVDNTGCTGCSVKIDSGTLPDTTIQGQLNGRLAAKGYNSANVATPVSVTCVAGS